MDLLKDYGSDSDGGGEAPASTVEAPTTVLARRVETAPAVLGALSLMKRPGSKKKEATTFGEMRTNLPAALVKAPIAGPSRSFGGGGHLQQMNLEASNVHAGGSVERAAIEEWSFDEQYNSFQGFGYCQDAAGGSHSNAKCDPHRRIRRSTALLVKLIMFGRI